jgi:peptidyl-tRNA hydrolase, PTH1 family
VAAIKLLLGLGNPGPRYRGTRHNLGFEWVDRLAERWNASFKPWRELGEIAEAQGPTGSVVLAKPLTFMNLSGRMAAALLQKRGGEASAVLVGYDDHALPLGQLRLRTKGSAGGHNGMQSVIDSLGTQEIPRLRFGIGPVPPTEDSAHFVLTRFAPAEKPVKEAMLDRACEAAEKALAEGFEKAMTAFNASS